MKERKSQFISFLVFYLTMMGVYNRAYVKGYEDGLKQGRKRKR